MPFNNAKLNYVRLYGKELILSEIVAPLQNRYRNACIAIWFRKKAVLLTADMVSRDSIFLRYRYHKYVIEIAKTFGGCASRA